MILRVFTQLVVMTLTMRLAEDIPWVVAWNDIPWVVTQNGG